MTVGVFLLAAALVGCGDNRSAATKAMELKFQNMDYRIGNMETGAASYARPYLEQATQQYVRLVRKYADQLGPAEARRRLVEKGDELSSYCVPCMATLYDEAKRY